jgi:hypothetical protein
VEAAVRRTPIATSADALERLAEVNAFLEERVKHNASEVSVRSAALREFGFPAAADGFALAAIESLMRIDRNGMEYWVPGSDEAQALVTALDLLYNTIEPKKSSSPRNRGGPAGASALLAGSIGKLRGRG